LYGFDVFGRSLRNPELIQRPRGILYMKKALAIIGIIIAVLAGSLLVTGIFLHSKSSIRFLLAMADVSKTADITRTERTLRVRGSEIPIMVFSSKSVQPGRYYFLLHGFTPESYQHPTIIKVAHSLCRVAKRTVLVPKISGSIEGGKSIPYLAHEVKDVYMAVKNEYPGRYNAFGACVAGTGLLVSLNLLPAEEYPEKIFLFGPFFTVQLLMEFYNNAGIHEVDYLVKMASALNTINKYTKQENALISKAIAASKPGTTDREAMRAILGDKLFKRIDEAKIDNREFADINEYSIFSKGKKLPNSEFYIIHSTTDDIIPYTMGFSLHKFLRQCGVKSRFVTTNVFGHSQNKMSISSYFKEFNEMLSFLDDLFEEND
jgi:hypothetical protein